MEQFKLENGERIIHESSLAHVQKKDADFVDPVKGKGLTYCKGILTDKRFVAIQKPQGGDAISLAFSPIIGLIMGKPVRFSIPLERLAVIEVGPGAGFTLKCSDGTGYRVGPDNLWTGQSLEVQRDKWVKAVSDAVVAACPAKTAQVTESRVEFK